MKTAWPSWLVLALAVTAPAQAKIAVELPVDGVVFGEPFELLVTFTPASGSGEAFDEGLLAPLVVASPTMVATGRPPGVTRRYVARCYVVGDVVLPFDPPVTLSVRSCLPDPPGELEWPGDGWQLPGASRSLWLLGGLLAVAGLCAFASWRWLRRSAAPLAGTAPVAGWNARHDLEALQLPGSDRVAIECYYGQLKAIVRRHCAERLSLPATARTSEELVQAAPRARDRLAPCFAACDHVLFAAVTPDEPAHTAARDCALSFVQATERPS